MFGEESLDNLEREEYKNWYRLYYPMVRRLVLDKGGSKEDAEEVFQESLIVFFEKTRDKDFTLTSKSSTFIYSVALNKWRDYIRKKNPSKAAHNINIIDQYSELEVDEYDSDKDSIIAELQKCIEKLSDNQKKIIISFYYQKKSMKEIATKYGFENDKSTKVQSWKAVQHLKKCIQIYKS